MRNILDLFGKSRLLTFDRDPDTREPTVELAHEALIHEWVRLHKWIDEGRYDLRMHELLTSAVAEWERADQDEGFLLRDAKLTQFAAWMADTSLALTATERAFLEASLAARKARQQRARRTRLIVGSVLVAATVISIGLAIWANGQRQRAEAAEQDALKQASVGLAAQALGQLSSDTPERGVLLALEALKNYPYTPQAESALAQSTYRTFRYTALPIRKLRAMTAAFSPDGDRIAVAGDEDIVSIWDASTHEELISIGGRDVESGNLSLAWSHDGQFIAVGSLNFHTIRLWDSASGELLSTYVGHSDEVRSVVLSRDDHLALSASSDGTARVWDVKTCEDRLVLSEHEGPVTEGQWSPDETLIATSSTDGLLRIWDARTGDRIQIIEAHPEGILALDWKPDGLEIATAGIDGTVRIWNWSTGTRLLTLLGHDDEVRDVEWSPDGTRLATAGGDGTVRIWDTQTGLELFSLPGGDADLWRVDWSPDGQFLIMGVGFNMRIWNLTEQSIRIPGHDILPGERCCLQAGRWLSSAEYLVTGGLDNTGRVWDIDTGQQIAATTVPVTSAPLPFGDLIYFTTDGNAIHRWNPFTGELQDIPIEEPVSWILPSATYAVGTSYDTEYRVYDLSTGDLMSAVLHDNCYFTGRPAWAPDGIRFSTICFSGESTDILIWDARTGGLLHRLIGHTDGGVANRWSPDGSRLATGGADNTVRIWDTETGQVLLVFSGHTEFVFDIDWSRDGSRIVSGDAAGWVRVWDTDTGEEVNSYKVAGSIYTVDWSPDGNLVAAVGAFQSPDIRPVWETTDDLISYAQECCVFRELTPEERQQFGLPPIIR